MALIIGPLTDPDLDPTQALVQAFLTIQQTLTPEKAHVTPASPPDHNGPLWRFELTAAVLDPDVTVFDGSVDGGLWRPTGAAAPAEIRGGLVVTCEHGLVVVGVHQGDEDDINELVEQALAHIQLITGD